MKDTAAKILDAADQLLAEAGHDGMSMQAVANEAFLLLPADQMNRATPRMLDAVELACTLMDGLRSKNP